MPCYFFLRPVLQAAGVVPVIFAPCTFGGNALQKKTKRLIQDGIGIIGPKCQRGGEIPIIAPFVGDFYIKMQRFLFVELIEHGDNVGQRVQLQLGVLQTPRDKRGLPPKSLQCCIWCQRKSCFRRFRSFARCAGFSQETSQAESV